MSFYHVLCTRARSNAAGRQLTDRTGFRGAGSIHAVISDIARLRRCRSNRAIKPCRAYGTLVLCFCSSARSVRPRWAGTLLWSITSSFTVVPCLTQAIHRCSATNAIMPGFTYQAVILCPLPHNRVVRSLQTKACLVDDDKIAHIADNAAK
jgi:hypothetical protein